MITLIKWNGRKDKVIATLQNEKGKRRGETGEHFVKRILPSLARSKRILTLSNDGK